MNRRAFTLIEALATLVFIGIVLPAVMGAVSVATRAASVATSRVEATMLAESKLEEILVTQSWEDGDAEGDFTESPSGQTLAEQRSGDGSTYRWELLVEDGPDLTMQQLRLRVTWERRGHGYDVELVTLVRAVE
ncbi:MAG: type II secretion system protein [Phycisphaeraceae bacterium]